MKRKRICTAAVMISMLLCWAMPGLADDEVITWRLQGWTNSDISMERNRRFAEDIKRTTTGRLVVEVYPGGAIVHPFEGLTAVSDGVYEINFGLPMNWADQLGPAATLFSCVPNGFNAAGEAMWFEYGGGRELHQELFDRQGYQVKVFQSGPRPMQNFLWANTPLRTLEDFRGLRMRMNPGMGDVLAKHGFSVLFTPAAEVLRSVQTGQFDAAKYGIPSSDKGIGLWEVFTHVMLPGVHCPSGLFEILINKTAYEALSDELKGQLETAIYAYSYKESLDAYAQDLDAVEFFEEQGIETVTMDPETVETFAKWADEWMEEQAAQDEFFAEVWNSQKAFAEKWYPYIRTHTLPH